MTCRARLVDCAIDVALLASIGMGVAWIVGRIAVALIAEVLEWRGR